MLAIEDSVLNVQDIIDTILDGTKVFPRIHHMVMSRLRNLTQLFVAIK